MRVEFVLSVPHDHPALPGHFPGRPIVPGVLLLDRAMSILQATVGRSVVHLDQVKFMSALEPGEIARIECDIVDARVAMRMVTSRNGETQVLAAGNMTLAAPATTAS